MSKRWTFLLIFLLSACASFADKGKGSSMETSSLPNLGPAPEFVNTVWLNADQPLRLADLRGQVVLVDMWTFG